MSVEDEVELKDLLVQTLTENGCLSKIKAQLRASVFLALEEDIKLSSQKPLMNEKVKSCLESSEGQLMFCIVKEFLEYFNLQSTIAVFDAESYLGVSYKYGGRTKISQDLGLNKEDKTVPLLQQVVHLAQQKPKTLEVDLNIVDTLEDVDNNISNSENSIKTETNLNGELSDSSGSSSSSAKENGISSTNGEVDNINLNGDEHNDTLNKTFTAVPRVKNPEEYNNSTVDNVTFVSQSSIEEIPVNLTHHFTLSTSMPENEITPPVLKELKISPERVKSPPKSDKFKSKNSLNSLSDLPPLNMNKNRSGTILPSLYSKEFREKPSS